MHRPKIELALSVRVRPLMATLLLTSVFGIGCQPPSNTEPVKPDPGPSTRLSAIAQSAVSHGFPGITVTVVPPGDAEIVTAAAGLADRRNDVAMTADSRIHAASTTKVFTAVAALLLVDRGVLDLDATLTELLPAELVGPVPNASLITLRDLLLHTSGIYSPNNDPIYLARYIGPDRRTHPFWTTKEIVGFAAHTGNEPAFEPGEGSHYSDINYALLSLIVAQVDGRPFKEFIDAEILRALGLRNTWFLSDDPARPRALGYTVDSEILRSIGLDPALEADADGFIDTTDAQEMSDGAAGLISTTPDLARFARAILLGDLLSESSTDLMREGLARLGDVGSETLGILRAHRSAIGDLLTASGDGPGTHVVWALHVDSGAIVAAATNVFGRFDEEDVLLQEVVPSALRAVGIVPANQPSD